MPTAEFRIFRSFSCNNSSSYRLVARFTDPAVAADAAQELETFFKTHALEMDALMEDGDVPDDPTNAATALAAKYGFTWDKLFTWGDEMLEGDEPKVTALDDTLVIYHTYCGGYPDEVKTYLEKRGAAKVEDQARSSPTVSLLFQMPASPSAELVADLDALFAQVDQEDDSVEPLDAPWDERKGRGAYGVAAMFRDGKTVGLYVPVEPDDLGRVRAWLTSRGIESPSIRLCAWDDKKKFEAIAWTKCEACGGTLEYLDPRVHGIEHEQLACKDCGGMFEVAPIVAAYKPPS